MPDTQEVHQTQQPLSPSTPHPKGGALQAMGLHPAVALPVVIIDTMLFGTTVSTGGIGWIASIPIGAALALATVLIQFKSYGDSFSVAVGKGLMVGIITAIPTPIPSAVTGISGVMGLIGLRKQKKVQ